MALTVTKSSGSDTALLHQQVTQLTTQFNALLTVLRAQLAKLDADGAVTATDYASDLDTGVKQVGNAAGTPL